MVNKDIAENSMAIANSITRPSFDEYIQWAKDNLLIDYKNDVLRRRYEQNSRSAYSKAHGHPFFALLSNFVNGCNNEYKNLVGSELLMTNIVDLSLNIKTFESMIDKSYRYNIVDNPNFGSPPAHLKNEWLTPQNWYYHVNDIIRTRIVCKYLDGPKFLSEELKSFANNHGIFCGCDSKQRDGGYYAYHFYVKIEVPLIIQEQGQDIAPDVGMKIEIQLTTQLQEIMDKLTHPIYERLRTNPDEDPNTWKWDHASDRFKASYMGHTLHMLEGIILEMRDRNRHLVVSEGNDNGK